MITIHHLGVSQSDRIVWLMEELGLPYDLKWYDRLNNLMPPEYLALHPAATAPVVTIDGRNLAESTAIVQYLCDCHADGRLTRKPGHPHYFDYLYWMQFNNNVQGLFFAKSAARVAVAPEKRPPPAFVQRREDGYYGYLEQHLGTVPYVAGDELTAADIMVAFNVTTLARFGGRRLDEMPNTQAYVQRLEARPAYIKAMAIAGPTATRPAA